MRKSLLLSFILFFSASSFLESTPDQESLTLELFEKWQNLVSERQAICDKACEIVLAEKGVAEFFDQEDIDLVDGFGDIQEKLLELWQDEVVEWQDESALNLLVVEFTFVQYFQTASKIFFTVFKRSDKGLSDLLRRYETKLFNLIKYAIDNGIDVNAQNDDGTAPLQIATFAMNNLELVDLLIKAGANLDCNDENYQMTALDFAICTAFLDCIVTYLENISSDMKDLNLGYGKHAHAVIAKLLQAGANTFSSADRIDQYMMIAQLILLQGQDVLDLIDVYGSMPEDQIDALYENAMISFEDDVLEDCPIDFKNTLKDATKKAVKFAWRVLSKFKAEDLMEAIESEADLLRDMLAA